MLNANTLMQAKHAGVKISDTEILAAAVGVLKVNNESLGNEAYVKSLFGALENMTGISSPAMKELMTAGKLDGNKVRTLLDRRLSYAQSSVAIALAKAHTHNAFVKAVSLGAGQDILTAMAQGLNAVNNTGTEATAGLLSAGVQRSLGLFEAKCRGGYFRYRDQTRRDTGGRFPEGCRENGFLPYAAEGWFAESGLFRRSLGRRENRGGGGDEVSSAQYAHSGLVARAGRRGA
jgi:hypothetical protein